MTTVWRVENESHRGPYNTEWNRQYDILNAHANTSHPTWSFDDMWDTDEDYVAAFRTREQLDEWFAGWAGPLSASGFEVVTYDCPELSMLDGRSGKQCAAFQPDLTNREVHSWDSREQLALF